MVDTHCTGAKLGCDVPGIKSSDTMPVDPNSPILHVGVDLSWHTMQGNRLLVPAQAAEGA